MDPTHFLQRYLTRRQLFDHARNGIGAAALATLLSSTPLARKPQEAGTPEHNVAVRRHRNAQAAIPDP